MIKDHESQVMGPNLGEKPVINSKELVCTTKHQRSPKLYEGISSLSVIMIETFTNRSWGEKVSHLWLSKYGMSG